MLQQATKDFLHFLKSHSEIRQQIRAPHNQTLLYAGRFFKPLWKEISELRRNNPEFKNKVILPDSLARIKVPNLPYSSLLNFVNEIEKEVPWNKDGFIIWRALSGIFAANATGAVSFQIGSGIETSTKVFAATEVGVLMRNPYIDSTTKEIVSYYQSCIRRKQMDLNFGFISA